MLVLTLAFVVTGILLLPIKDTSRDILLSIVGIVISGMFAFSSTSVISNLMGGVLLRMTKPFHVGDFIRIGEHFGRVSERGLFHTEIQTETRELISLPNTYCITNPVTTTRSSGTIISASLSLGYDLHHNQIEPLLIEAAENSGLAEPYVHILELGNFSVIYRVSGFLENPKHLLSMRSKLYASVLDTLHNQGIEIMSPSFMNQRQLEKNARAIPRSHYSATKEQNDVAAEDIVFDKAEQAEKTENEKLQLKQEINRLETLVKDITNDDKKQSTLQTIKHLKSILKSLEDTEQASDSQK